MAVSSQTEFDETSLVTQAREGDNRAFADLAKHYEAKIFRLAQHIFWLCCWPVLWNRKNSGQWKRE